MAKTKRNTSGSKQTARKMRRAPDEPLELLPATIPKSFEERWSPILVIAALVFIAYLPTLDNEFVSWDDDHYIFDNRQVSEPDGLRSIWFDVFTYSSERFRRPNNEKRVSHQYYPIVFTTHWLEYRLFGGDDSKKTDDQRVGGKPYKRSLTIEEQIDAGNMSHTGFHVTNTLLHMVNVMVMVFMLRALGLSSWVAWAATILFALHPMQTASVAWAAERKNILSLMFYMLSIISYVKLRRTGSWWRYVLTIVFFQAALFSKTVALTLPITLFFTDRLLERRWNAKLVVQSMVRMLPLLALTAIAAWTTMSVEDRQRTIPLTSAQRPFVPCASLLFYAGKMLLPIGQSPIYRLWNPDPQSFIWFIPILIVLALATAIIFYRKKLGPHFMWAVLMYCVIMGPMLGFKNINYFQFAFVADHYFYHGALGLCLILGIGADALRRRIAHKPRGNLIATAVVLVVALAYGARTYVYSSVWKNSDTFWARTFIINPRCWPGHFNVGNARAKEARKEKDPAEKAKLYEEAVDHYKIVADINHGIRQPVDQWVRICQIQKNWKCMLEGALAGVERFGYMPKYYLAAARAYTGLGDTKNAKKWYDKTITSAQRRRKPNAAVSACNEAASLAANDGRLEDAANYRIQACKIMESLGDAHAKNKRPCRAGESYGYARQYLSRAPRVDSRRDAIRNLAERLNQKLAKASAACSDK